MCNINEKTDLNSVTVYKVVYKCKNSSRYFACFSGMEIKVGDVEKNYTPNKEYFEGTDIGVEWYWFTPLSDRNTLYNRNVVGRTTGFESKRWGKVLFNLISKRENAVLVKMILGGDIMKGDASRISTVIPTSAIVYAGTKILSIEEV